jgi:serine/threonine protein phosphatase PrpC
LWDVVSDGEVAAMVSSEMNAALLANKLLTRALRGSKDNITIIVAVL